MLSQKTLALLLPLFLAFSPATLGLPQAGAEVPSKSLDGYSSQISNMPDPVDYGYLPHSHSHHPWSKTHTGPHHYPTGTGKYDQLDRNAFFSGPGAGLDGGDDTTDPYDDTTDPDTTGADTAGADQTGADEDPADNPQDTQQYDSYGPDGADAGFDGTGPDTEQFAATGPGGYSGLGSSMNDAYGMNNPYGPDDSGYDGLSGYGGGPMDGLGSTGDAISISKPSPEQRDAAQKLIQALGLTGTKTSFVVDVDAISNPAPAAASGSASPQASGFAMPLVAPFRIYGAKDSSKVPNADPASAKAHLPATAPSGSLYGGAYGDAGDPYSTYSDQYDGEDYPLIGPSGVMSAPLASASPIPGPPPAARRFN